MVENLTSQNCQHTKACEIWSGVILQEGELDSTSILKGLFGSSMIYKYYPTVSIHPTGPCEPLVHKVEHIHCRPSDLYISVRYIRDVFRHLSELSDLLSNT